MTYILEFNVILNYTKMLMKRKGRDILDKKKLAANLMLILTAVIWGSAFVAQRVGMDYVGPLAFNTTRFIFSALTLIPVMYFRGREKKKWFNEGFVDNPLFQEDIKKQRKNLIKAGCICGVILFCASTFQQFGLVFTTAGKTAFITALYILLVPIFSLLLRHRPGIQCWIGVAFGTVGLYLLCITESFTIARGDLIVLIGAGFWTAHILAIDYFLPQITNPVKLSFIQFCACALISLICTLLFEDISIPAIGTAIIPILYAGVLSGGVGFTLQIIGQRNANPTVASLILSMEAVFGAVFGYFILQEILTPREFMGCVLMFAAIIISQLPERRKRNENLKQPDRVNR